MNARRFLFAIAVTALVWNFGNWPKTLASWDSLTRIGIADGTAPLPPLPRPTRDFMPTLVADGTAPLPPLPRKDA